MLLFAAHDPGAWNHIWPIYEHALTVGEAPEFVDLSSSEEFMDDREASRLVRDLRPELLIAGCSMNQAEWTLIRACTREGVKSTAMIGRWGNTETRRYSPGRLSCSLYGYKFWLQRGIDRLWGTPGKRGSNWERSSGTFV